MQRALNGHVQWKKLVSHVQEKNINLASPSLPLHKYPMLKKKEMCLQFQGQERVTSELNPQTVFQILREEPAILKQFRTQYP